MKGDILKNISYTNLNEEIEVEYASDSPVKSDEYNKLYRNWRCSESNPFVFSGKRSSKLYTYVDGVGMHNENSEKHERSALKNICKLITTVIYIYALAENVFVLPFILTLKCFGVEISYSFHDSSVYGDQYAVAATFIFEGIMKFLVPLLFVRRVLKMPSKVAYPLKVENKWSLFTAVSTMLVALSIAMLIRVYLPTNIFIVNDVNTIYNISLGMNNGCTAVLLVFELIAVPIMKELIFHGAIFQAMRQSGVSFAVLTIAIIATVEMHNPFSAGINFVIFFIAGYCVWNSGSVIGGIIVHIIGRTLSFSMFYFKELPPVNGIQLELAFIFSVFIIGLAGSLILIAFKGKTLKMKDYGTFIPIKEKLKYSLFKTPLILAWILLGMLMITEIFV